MEEVHIAPCGMNCSVCIAYQFQQNELNKLGFKRAYCLGCITRGENCKHMKDSCELLKEGKVRFCYECDSFPCKRLKSLDKRYRSKYHLSMIDNLKLIQEMGMDAFLEKEKIKWSCPKCGSYICCHNGLCLNCELDVLRKNKRYRWNKENTDGKVE